VAGVLEAETADTADEHVGDGEMNMPQRTLTVEEDRPWPWRLCEGGLEFAAGDAADEMRQCVGEECAAEE